MLSWFRVPYLRGQFHKAVCTLHWAQNAQWVLSSTMLHKRFFLKCRLWAHPFNFNSASNTLAPYYILRPALSVVVLYPLRHAPNFYEIHLYECGQLKERTTWLFTTGPKNSLIITNLFWCLNSLKQTANKFWHRPCSRMQKFSTVWTMNHIFVKKTNIFLHFFYYFQRYAVHVINIFYAHPQIAVHVINVFMPTLK